MLRKFSEEKGVVLSVVVIALLMMTAIGYAAALLAFNQNKVFSATSGKRILSYYRAQDGMIDAFWRIRNNITTGMTTKTPGATPPSPSNNFLDPLWEPNSYGLDIDPDTPVVTTVNDPVTDVTVTIGAMVNGTRSVKASGKDV